MRLVATVVLSGAVLGTGCGNTDKEGAAESSTSEDDAMSDSAGGGGSGVATSASGSEDGLSTDSEHDDGAGGTANQHDATSASVGGESGAQLQAGEAGGASTSTNGEETNGEEASEETAGADFYFLGYDADPDPEAQYCIYAYHFGRAPTDIFCSAFPIEASHAPQGDWLGIAFILSLPTPDIFPQLLIRLDLTTGEATQVGEYGYSLLAGSWEQVREVWSLGPDRTLLSRSSNTSDGPYNLVRIEGESTPLTMLRDAQPAQHHIVGQLGEQPIISVPEQGVTLALSPDGSLSSVGAEGDSVVQLAPFGERALFSGPDGNGDTRLSVVELGSAQPQYELIGSAQAGWVGNDRILTSTDEGYVVWTLRDEDPLRILEAPDYEPAGGHLLGESFAAFRATRDGESGIGWFIYGQFEEFCGSRDVVRTLELPAHQDSPMVLFDDAELDRYQAGVGSIYSCEPGGTPVDLLAEFGLQGRLLSIPMRRDDE